MQDAVPSNVIELGERNQLGEFVCCHRGPTTISVLYKSVLFNLILGASCALISTFGIVSISKGHISFLQTFLVIFCLFFFVYQEGFQLLRAYIRGAIKQRVYEFAEGIVIAKSRLLLYPSRWKDFSDVTYEQAEMTFSASKVSTYNKKSYMLYCAAIIPRIEQEIMSRNLPDMLTRYEAGETLKFGKIRVDKEGITTGSYNNRDEHKRPIKSIRWSEVYLQVKERDLSICFIKKADGKSFRISLFDIPNACLLRALLQSILSPTRDIFQQQIQIAEQSPDMLR